MSRFSVKYLKEHDFARYGPFPLSTDPLRDPLRAEVQLVTERAFMKTSDGNPNQQKFSKPKGKVTNDVLLNIYNDWMTKKEAIVTEYTNDRTRKAKQYEVMLQKAKMTSGYKQLLAKIEASQTQEQQEYDEKINNLTPENATEILLEGRRHELRKAEAQAEQLRLDIQTTRNAERAAAAEAEREEDRRDATVALHENGKENESMSAATRAADLKKLDNLTEKAKMANDKAFKLKYEVSKLCNTLVEEQLEQRAAAVLQQRQRERSRSRLRNRGSLSVKDMHRLKLTSSTSKL